MCNTTQSVALWFNRYIIVTNTVQYAGYNLVKSSPKYKRNKVFSQVPLLCFGNVPTQLENVYCKLPYIKRDAGSILLIHIFLFSK